MRSVVVADTSPLRYLAEIENIDLLLKLIGSISVPTIVFAELQHPSTPPIVRAQFKPDSLSWLQVIEVAKALPDQAWFAGLDDGEADALRLASQLSADLILIDERRGNESARELGFETTGTLGVLVRASQRGYIDLADAFARLRKTDFHCPEGLMRKLLAAER